MQKQPDVTDIYNINYPCYVSPVPEGTRIIHIPGVMEYQHLDNTYGYVIEGYQTPEKLYLFDCIPLVLWYKQKCLIAYEDRLKDIRILVNSYIANPKKVIDLNALLIDNQIEMADYLDNLLTQGYKKARIMDANGNYVFGEAKNNEYVEIDL